EMGDTLFRDHDALARARVAPDARRAPVDGKAAEPTDLDAVALDQSLAHGVENGLDGKLGVTVRELAEAAGKGFDEVAAGHVLCCKLCSTGCREYLGRDADGRHEARRRCHACWRWPD